MIDGDQQWLINSLNATLDTNQQVRSIAETSLNQASYQPGFGSVLSKIAANRDLPLGSRQLAAVLLKQFVKKHWQEDEEAFEHPIVSDQEKILAILADALIEIQEQVLAEGDQNSEWEDVEVGDTETVHDLICSADASSNSRLPDSYLDVMAKAFNEDQDDSYDDDLLCAADPLNEINLPSYLTNFLVEFSHGDRLLFDHLWQSLIPP